MINLFFSRQGYYIVGDGVEISRSCPPLTNNGVPVLQPTHHLYAVLIRAMDELTQISSIDGDVTVFNDSRVIEDMNGGECLDETSKTLKMYIKRVCVPSIPSIVWFRKKSCEWIEEKIREGHRSMLHSPDVKKIASHLAEASKRQKTDTVIRLKESWLKGDHNDS